MKGFCEIRDITEAYPGNGKEAKVLVTFRKKLVGNVGTEQEFLGSHSHSFDEKTGWIGKEGGRRISASLCPHQRSFVK